MLSQTLVTIDIFATCKQSAVGAGDKAGPARVSDTLPSHAGSIITRPRGDQKAQNGREQVSGPKVAADESCQSRSEPPFSHFARPLSPPRAFETLSQRFDDLPISSRGHNDGGKDGQTRKQREQHGRTGKWAAMRFIIGQAFFLKCMWP